MRHARPPLGPAPAVIDAGLSSELAPSCGRLPAVGQASEHILAFDQHRGTVKSSPKSWAVSIAA